MEIYLVRHTSVNVPAGYAYGQTDVPLHPTFEKEAEAVKRPYPAIHSTRCGVAGITRCTPHRRLLWLPGRRKGRPHQRNQFRRMGNEIVGRTILRSSIESGSMTGSTFQLPRANLCKINTTGSVISWTK